MRYHKTVLLNSLLTEFIEVTEKMNKYMNRVLPKKWDEQLIVYSNHLKMVLEEFNKIKNSSLKRAVNQEKPNALIKCELKSSNPILPGCYLFLS